MIGTGAPFDLPAAVLVLVRTCFNEGNYRLNHIAEEVGAKLALRAWATLVCEVGKPTARQEFRAYELSVREHEARRQDFEAQFAEMKAEWHREQAAALRGELVCDDLAMF